MRINIGDIFEIETPIGLAYVHFIHQDNSIGELIRILPGIYSWKPNDLDLLVQSKERFMVFFPLKAAFKRKIVKAVGHYPADQFSKPKFMRSPHIVQGEMLGWHIINTETWQRKLVDKLKIEEVGLSPWGIWNDTLLIENLVNNWSLENWT